jgi:pyruvate dehydrogenase E2 component (dihydrolipoamide acetyltransferase)
MDFQLILPDLGEGIVEAEIQKWLVQPGDEVAEEQAVVEVMTDKATVTIPSPRRGRVTRLRWKEGELAPVHAPLLDLAVAGPVADAERPAAPPLAAQARPPPASASPPAAPGVLATPAVRALARARGVDLGAVRGTGPGGRVTERDLESAAGAAPPQDPATAPPEPGRVEVIPLRGLRRRIAERTARSTRTAAHFTFVEQVDVTELVRVKERAAARALGQGVRVTFLPFLVKAAVEALKEFPLLNASLDEAKGELRLKRWYDIGIATATGEGLVVPVVRRAGERALLDLAREIERLAGEARAGKVRPEDVGGSTFTVTSLGAIGGLFATPVINYPEVAILGVHRIRPTPVVRDGQVVVRDVMHLSLTSDHRVVDGHVAAAFTYAVIRLVEDPARLFPEVPA